MHKKIHKKQKDNFDDSYKNGIKNSEGKTAIRPLNEQETAWLEKFNDEFCDNHHGDANSIHRTLPDYEQRKSEFYRETNLKNRDLLSNLKAQGQAVIEFDDRFTSMVADDDPLIDIYKTKSLSAAMAYICDSFLLEGEHTKKRLQQAFKEAFRLFTYHKRIEKLEKK